MNLDNNVLQKHKQKYDNSCVAMGVEAVLKLNGAMPIDDYSLQDRLAAEPNKWNCGDKYHGYRRDQDGRTGSDRSKLKETKALV